MAGNGSPDSAGAAGTGASGDAGAAGAASGGAAGAAGREDAGGAGGADPCAGDPAYAGSGAYECPEVIYWSHAIIKLDLPVSAADAADAVFTVCRNDECHSAKGSTKVNDFTGTYAWAAAMNSNFVYLTLDGSGAAPFAVVDWTFDVEWPIASDHYSVAIQPLSAAAPSTLFDEQVNYTTTVADPSLVGEGYCRHCSEVSLATVDARTPH
jgi:hypothetical protein